MNSLSHIVFMQLLLEERDNQSIVRVLQYVRTLSVSVFSSESEAELSVFVKLLPVSAVTLFVSNMTGTDGLHALKL